MSDDGWLAGRDPFALRSGRRWRRPPVRQAWSPTVVSLLAGPCIATLVITATGLLGWEPAELALFPFAELIHPDDREVFSASVVAVSTSVETSRFVPIAMRVLSRNSRYWRMSGYLAKRPGHELVVARMSSVDSVGAIGNPIGVWRWDADRDIVTWSPELLAMFGLRLGPPASYSAFLDTIVEEDRGDVARHIERARDHADEFTATFRCIGRGEHQPWFHAAGRGSFTTAEGRHVAGIVKYLNPPRTWWVASPIGCG